MKTVEQERECNCLGSRSKNTALSKFIYTKVYTVEHLWILSQERADGEGVRYANVFKD